MKITSNQSVHQITFLPHLFPVNCYLFEEEASLTLIDTALPKCEDKILEVAKRIGKPITKIVISHAHGDHIGSLDAIKRKCKDAVVYISKRDSKLLSGDRTLGVGEPNSPIRGGVPKIGQIETKPDVLLEEGDSVGSLAVIATPGHTPGSISLLNKDRGIAIVGDALHTRGGLTVTGQFNMWFPFPYMATWNKSMALDSAKKIANYKPTLLATGHGKMISISEKTLGKLF